MNMDDILNTNKNINFNASCLKESKESCNKEK